LFSANIFNSIERIKSALSQIKVLMHINVLPICIHSAVCFYACFWLSEQFELSHRYFLALQC